MVVKFGSYIVDGLREYKTTHLDLYPTFRRAARGRVGRPWPQDQPWIHGDVRGQGVQVSPHYNLAITTDMFMPAKTLPITTLGYS